MEAAEPAAAQPPLAPYYTWLRRARTADEAVAVWRSHRTTLAQVEQPERRAAWDALVARADSFGTITGGVGAWLRRALAAADARELPAQDGGAP